MCNALHCHWPMVVQTHLFAVIAFPNEVDSAHGYHETQQNPCFPYHFFHYFKFLSWL